MPPEHTLIIEGKASYMDKIRAFEKDMLEKRQQAIQKTFYRLGVARPFLMLEAFF